MDKMFYKDPLAAAYMAREYDIVYWDGLGCEENYNQVWWEVDDEYFYDIDERVVDTAYIHSDYHHIFEPQVGDLVLSETGYACVVVSDDQKRVIYEETESETHLLDMFSFHSLSTIRAEIEDGFSWSIIQRNGKPFFMPEIEQ